MTDSPFLPVLVDSHEDLAWNMLSFHRDYTLSSQQIRAAESKSNVPVLNGDSLLGYADYQAANVRLIFSTLFAAPVRAQEGEWDTQVYRTGEEAYQRYRHQLEVYFRLTDAHPDLFQLIRTRAELTLLLNRDTASKPPIGLLPSMEGADGIRSPQAVSEWAEQGVRLIGLAWQATRYAGGTKEPGPLTPDGFELLRAMEEAGCVLDFSHLDEQAARQALDAFPGRVMASHINPWHFLQDRPSNRFVKDDMIRAIAERGGVMGFVPYNIFLDPYWKRGEDKNLVSIRQYVEQIDYVCQLVGSSRQVGIGTDFDGGFGVQHVPAEINSIADLPVIIPLLQEKGYTSQDIENIFGNNWIRFLMEVLP